MLPTDIVPHANSSNVIFFFIVVCYFLSAHTRTVTDPIHIPNTIHAKGYYRTMPSAEDRKKALVRALLPPNILERVLPEFSGTP